MATAIASALSHIPVRRDIAMTGEITLRGKVLPIGGLKEKLLAAHRAGIMEVMLPADNEKDLADVPENLRNVMKLHFVNTMDEVLAFALERPLPEVPDETRRELRRCLRRRSKRPRLTSNRDCQATQREARRVSAGLAVCGVRYPFQHQPHSATASLTCAFSPLRRYWSA